MNVITTLGQLRSERYTVTAHCGACPHSKTVNLDILCAKLGDDFVFIGWPVALRSRIRCGQCHSRGYDASFIIAPPDVPTPGGQVYG